MRPARIPVWHPRCVRFSLSVLVGEYLHDNNDDNHDQCDGEYLHSDL